MPVQSNVFSAHVDRWLPIRRSPTTIKGQLLTSALIAEEPLFRSAARLFRGAVSSLKLGVFP